jgi:hypothetical protein
MGRLAQKETDLIKVGYRRRLIYLRKRDEEESVQCLQEFPCFFFSYARTSIRNKKV